MPSAHAKKSSVGRTLGVVAFGSPLHGGAPGKDKGGAVVVVAGEVTEDVVVGEVAVGVGDDGRETDGTAKCGCLEIRVARNSVVLEEALSWPTMNAPIVIPARMTTALTAVINL